MNCDDTTARVAPITLRPLLTIRMMVDAPIHLGATPDGERHTGWITGGAFAGERLRGRVVPGGSDWQIQRPDGALTLDVRVMLETEQGETIAMFYHGFRRGPTDVIDAIDRGENPDPSLYHFRVSARFSTGSSRLSWMNGILAIGSG